jgi:hypothetical protein
MKIGDRVNVKRIARHVWHLDYELDNGLVADFKRNSVLVLVDDETIKPRTQHLPAESGWYSLDSYEIVVQA